MDLDGQRSLALPSTARHGAVVWPIVRDYCRASPGVLEPRTGGRPGDSEYRSPGCRPASGIHHGLRVTPLPAY
jgi:hypothetical protein